jgi:hypothetical protein
MVSIDFDKTDRKQIFVSYINNEGIDLSETFIVENSRPPANRIFQEDPLCEISISKNAFIIKINEELIKYDNEKIKNIELHMIGGNHSNAMYYNATIAQVNKSLFKIDSNGTIIAYEGPGYIRLSNPTVVIPTQIDDIPITAIGKNVFREKCLVNDIIIPDSVTSIGDWAFYFNQLILVIIPSRVSSIGEGAFCHNQLTSVIISDGITSISDRAFSNNLLSSVTITDNVTSIGVHAFSDNIIRSVIIPDGVIIGDSAFNKNRLTRIVIGENVTLGAGGRGDPSFDNDFDNFYYDNGRKAGTYILNNEQWSIR